MIFEFPKGISTTWGIYGECFFTLWSSVSQIQVSDKLNLQLQPGPNRFCSFHWFCLHFKAAVDTLESWMNRCFSGRWCPCWSKRSWSWLHGVKLLSASPSRFQPSRSSVLIPSARSFACQSPRINPGDPTLHDFDIEPLRKWPKIIGFGGVPLIFKQILLRTHREIFIPKHVDMVVPLPSPAIQRGWKIHQLERFFFLWEPPCIERVPATFDYRRVVPCGGFHGHGGTPKWMVYFMENPIGMDDDWGLPPF